MGNATTVRAAARNAAARAAAALPRLALRTDLNGASGDACRSWTGTAALAPNSC